MVQSKVDFNEVDLMTTVCAEIDGVTEIERSFTGFFEVVDSLLAGM